MSRLDELIKELCPDGVEYKQIGDFAEVKTGKGITKKDSVEHGEFPIISGGKEPMGYYHSSNRLANTLTISRVGANAGFVNYIIEDFYLNDKCFSVVPTSDYVDKINSKFLYYATKSLENDIVAMQSEGGVPTINTQKVCCIKLPVPPLPVQEEIVKILDKFTDYVTELQAELQARRLQYEYYMNDLFNIQDEGKYEYKTGGELFEIRNGLNKEKSAFGKGKPIINFTDVYKNRWLTKESFKGLVDVNIDEIERYSAKLGDVFFTRTSETKEDIGMSSTLVEDIPNCVFSGFVLRERPTTDLLLPKFCAYYFSTLAVRKDIVRYASFTTRATTTGPKLYKIKVPILPKQEQQRIIDILDRFDLLTNDITSGLPAEIEARQKQYEYYRDKLLSFKEIEL